MLVGYKAKDYTVSAQTEKKATAVTASYYHAIAPDMTAAAVAKFPLAPKASVAGFDVEIGLAYRLAADTTVTTKVNSAGKVAASYAAQVSPVTKLTFAAEVDAANISRWVDRQWVRTQSWFFPALRHHYFLPSISFIVLCALICVLPPQRRPPLWAQDRGAALSSQPSPSFARAGAEGGVRSPAFVGLHGGRGWVVQ